MALIEADPTTVDGDDEWVPEDTFAARLALVRQKRGWNYTQAGEACGIDPESWRQWERGRSPHNLHEKARKISRGAGCSYNWLVVGGSLRAVTLWIADDFHSRPYQTDIFDVLDAPPPPLLEIV